MKAIAINVGANRKIINPGDITVKRNEQVGWICDDFAFEVYFDPANNPGNNPEHPFKTAPPNPPPGHVTGPKDEFHKRHVRPRAAQNTIPDGTRYKYNIKIKDATGATVDELDPDLIVDGDK
jgi:hypothetical protein